jgi:peptidyl-prolyl cis-trans isomerase D
MTMLDRMRRHKNWLKWSLFIVVIAFIFLYIPSFLKPSAYGAAPSDTIATVNGSDISVARFRQAYQRQIQQYRQAYGGQLDERMLKQLGIDQRIVQQMIEEEVALAEAKRLGIKATDEEVRQRILALPAFQEDGNFIGDQRYRQILNMQNPPMRPDEFEEQVRRGLIVEKLQSAITNWITVSDTEVDTEVKNRNEKVKLAVITFPADKFRASVNVSDDEIAKHFEAHKDSYKIPEKRKVRFATIDMQAIRERTQVSAADIQRSYDENQQQYSTPEQVRASHILLKTEGKDDAVVKKQAEDLLAKVKAGADFAELAKKNSQDEASAAKGGDLDFFGKGQMVPEFDKVAFSLEPGKINDTVVKTQYGYHIIKVTDKKPATTQPLEQVKGQIEDQLKWERAQSEADRIANEVGAQLKKPSDFDTVAKARGLTVGESNLFSKEDPIIGIGMAPPVNQRAFEMKEGEVSDAIRTQQGYAFITLIGRQDAYTPKLDEVKLRVKEDVAKAKAVEAARQKAAEVAATAKTGNLEAAAKSAGLEVKTTELIPRGSTITDVGISPAVDAAAFSLPAGGVSSPIVTDTGAVVVKVLERKDATPEEIAKGKTEIKDQLMRERRDRFYGAYMNKARQTMKIDFNRAAITSVVGS